MLRTARVSSDVAARRGVRGAGGLQVAPVTMAPYVVADGRRLPLPWSGIGRGVLGSRGTVVTGPGAGPAGRCLDAVGH